MSVSNTDLLKRYAEIYWKQVNAGANGMMFTNEKGYDKLVAKEAGLRDRIISKMRKT